MEQFLEMLEFCRPAGSVYEEAFLDRYLRPLGTVADDFGNLRLDVGSKPNVLWSSHTDTVHTTSKLQTVWVDKNKIARVRYPLESACLGADCTTGVYIMMKMIEAGVEGRYIFHRDEEHGGNGSKYIAKNTPDLLKGIDAAIAFDRKGMFDIITHQGSSQTASRDFANSLGIAIGMKHTPSANGSFTDTKSYMALVPECTNISVGYSDAHRNTESQDLIYLQNLIDKMISIDTSGLIIKRTPEAEKVYVYQPSSQYRYVGGGYIPPSQQYKEPETIDDLVRQNPMSVAYILREFYGLAMDELGEMIDMVQEFRQKNTDGRALPLALIAPPRKVKIKRNRKLKTGIN